MADMASELEAAAFRLRRAGQDDLARELTRAMREAVKPVPDQIRAGLVPHMPTRYAEILDADTDIKTVTRSGGSNTDAVVSVYATGRGGVARRRYKRLDGGILEHPVFGDRTDWKKQGQETGAKKPIPGWFTGACQAAGPRVRDGLEQALRDVAAKAEGA